MQLIRRVGSGEAVSWWDEPASEDERRMRQMMAVPEDCEHIELDMSVEEFMEQARADCGSEEVGTVYVEDSIEDAPEGS